MSRSSQGFIRSPSGAGRSSSTSSTRCWASHPDNGYERGTIYALAAFTGFRFSEVRSLTWNQLSLDDELPHLQLYGSQAKNLSDKTLVLKPWLVDRLRRFTGLPTARLFPSYPWTMLVEHLRRDAAAAGLGNVVQLSHQTAKGDTVRHLRWEDPSGPEWRLDFHSLRHSFNTWVGGTNAGERDVQDMGRHTDAKTSRRYWHGNLRRQRAILDQIPDPMPCAPDVHGERQADNL